MPGWLDRASHHLGFAQNRAAVLSNQRYIEAVQLPKMPADQRQVRLDSLGPRELQMIQEQLQEELQGLSQSSLTLQKAAAEYGTSGRAVEQLAGNKKGSMWSALASWQLRMCQSTLSQQACCRADCIDTFDRVALCGGRIGRR